MADKIKLSRLDFLKNENDLVILGSQIYYFMTMHIQYYSSTKEEKEKYIDDYRKCITKEDYVRFAEKLDLTIDIKYV